MENFDSFLLSWNEVVRPIALGAVVIGLLIYLIYEVRLFFIKDPKQKYDFINHNEIKAFMRSAIAYVVGGTLFINTLATSMVASHGTFGIAIRVFVSFCFFTIAYYLLANIIQVLYPTFLEKRLMLLRGKPRLSPTGNTMRLLTEAEEDIHLDEGMQTEERFFTVDYDVWVDDASGYRRIEKYMAFEHAEQCSECEYFTLKEDWELIVQAPTQHEAGTVQRHFTCQYCDHKESRMVPVAKLSTNTAVETPQTVTVTR